MAPWDEGRLGQGANGPPYFFLKNINIYLGTIF